MDISLNALGAGVVHHLPAEGIHAVAVGVAVLRVIVGQGSLANLGHQLGQDQLGAVQRRAVLGLQGARDLSQADAAHARAAFARFVGEALVDGGSQRDFGIKQEGVVLFV
ncbi:hypothetical protein [Stutzerimonas nitrititolerans]|uniref:hypothetical protein n=1 Tax=Stutzerimonas nitrititolerans TaxID=2482751 RepID=UPI0028AE7D16|nr:hypothetical protein [Stutzerimonas nitrititolerans]